MNSIETRDDLSEFKLNYLDPKKVKFFRHGDILRVTIEGDRSCLRVVPMRSFPISMRDKYISIRDIKGNELGIIRDPKDLDKESYRLLEEEIHKRYFVPVILKVKSIRDKLGIVEWEIMTDRGFRKFLTRSIHNSIEETYKGFMIKDIENNKYELHDYSELDPKSVELLNKKI
ncbi:MAG: DUF1854 domain-containing protein [bacterium]